MESIRGVEFRLLGPTEAWLDGVPCALGPRQQRIVLAVLLLEANRHVSVDRLIRMLWSDPPPDAARITVQAHVSRLRKALRPSGIGREDLELVTAGNGYQIRVDPGSVDVYRFGALVAQARAAGGGHAVALYRQALGLWRGDALADVVAERSRDLLCRELEEARLGVAEDCADLELALGRHQELVPELTGRVARYPARTRMVRQLMLALYRSGRHAEALIAFQRVRTWMAEEFGLDPCPSLSELNAAILRRDPALDASDPSCCRRAALGAVGTAGAASSIA